MSTLVDRKGQFKTNDVYEKSSGNWMIYGSDGIWKSVLASADNYNAIITVQPPYTRVFPPAPFVRSEAAASASQADAAINGGPNNPAAVAAAVPGRTLTFADFKRTENSAKLVLSYPSSLKNAAGATDYVRFAFKEYKPPFKEAAARGDQAGYNQNLVNLQPAKDLSIIALYMPEDIQAQYGTQWGGKSIQNVTGTLLQGLGNAVEGDMSALLTDMGTKAGSLVEGGFVSVVNKILDGLQKTGQGEGLSTNDIFSSTAGIVINPNTELLFNGFDLRKFDLTFKMVANSNKEAQEIKTIITTFKRAMLPSINNNATAKNTETELQNFIKVPSIVEVTYMSGASPNPYLTQFKPCAITSFNINYTADGAYATYYTGAPIAITMQIGFSETKLIYREDITDQGPSF